jgi:hypothetical protein
MTLGYKLAFDMNLLALAATYPNDFTACSGGGLQTFLDEFPGDFSGPLGSISGMQVKGIQEISGDATNVLCGAIGLMSGKGNWDENVLWQGTANIANAIFKTIQLGLAAEPSISISAKQVTGLCAVTKAVWSFATNKPAVGGYVIVTVPAPVIAPTEISKPCYTAEPQVGGCGNPGNTFEGLAEGHSLDKTSPTAIVCNWDETSRLSDSSKSSAASVSDNIFRLVGAGHRPGARKSG